MSAAMAKGNDKVHASASVDNNHKQGRSRRNDYTKEHAAVVRNENANSVMQSGFQICASGLPGSRGPPGNCKVKMLKNFSLLVIKKHILLKKWLTMFFHLKNFSEFNSVSKILCLYKTNMHR